MAVREMEGVAQSTKKSSAEQAALPSETNQPDGSQFVTVELGQMKVGGVQPNGLQTSHPIYPKLTADPRASPQASGNKQAPPPPPPHNKDGPPPGYIRHMVALLALSSIALANMNRQAFNLSLTRMASEIKIHVDPIPDSPIIADPDEVPALDTAKVVAPLIEAAKLGQPNEPPRSWPTTTTRKPDDTTTTTKAPTTQATMQTVQLTTISSTNTGNLVARSYLAAGDGTMPPMGDPTLSITATPEASTLSSTSNQSGGSTEFSVELIPMDDAEALEDKFDWTTDQIATLQMAFYYGYAPFMIISGRLSEIYGAKWVVFVSGFGSALCCILAPFFADLNYYLLVATRIAMGLCQTGVSPALYALLSRWLPPNEASVYLPMIKVGVSVGLMSGSLVGGFFAWRSTFYFAGFIGLLWSLLWALTVSSDPKDHKWLSKGERSYIVSEIQGANKQAAKTDAERKQSAPWLRILTNPVVLAFMLTKFTVKLSTDAQSVQVPMFLKQAYKISPELNGFLNATYQALQVLLTGFVAYMAKEMVVRQTCGLSKTGVRRLFQGICNYGMAASYALMAMGQGSLTIVCTAIVINAAASMFGAGGEAVLPIDLSLEYSASIMAIANSFANLSGIVLPSIVVFLVGKHMSDESHWALVWYVVAGLMVAGATIFVFVVRAEIQDFSKSKKANKKRDKVLAAEMASNELEKSPIALVEMTRIKRRCSD